MTLARWMVTVAVLLGSAACSAATGPAERPVGGATPEPIEASEPADARGDEAEKEAVSRAVRLPRGDASPDHSLAVVRGG